MENETKKQISEKTYNQIISEKEVEIENKFKEWIKGQSNLFAKRIYTDIKQDETYSEEELSKELNFIINSMVSSIQQHRRDINTLQDARHII